MEVIIELFQPLIIKHKEIVNSAEEIRNLNKTLNTIKDNIDKYINPVDPLNDIYNMRKQLLEMGEKQSVLRQQYARLHERALLLLDETGAEDFNVTINVNDKEETYKIRRKIDAAGAAIFGVGEDHIYFMKMS